eukprot:5143249-Amphidinium_carterae.1
MPASKPYLPKMPIIPPDSLAETVGLTDSKFSVFEVWKTAMSKAFYPIFQDAQAMENYKPHSVKAAEVLASFKLANQKSDFAKAAVALIATKL